MKYALRLTVPALVAALASVTPAASAAEVVSHPNDLAFKPFVYTPPAAKAYRVPLKGGIVAYLAEDHELPLVTVSVTVRGGTYLSPAGKEGLAELAGYLLARGGTKSWTAEQLEERLAFLAANLTSSIGDDRGNVTLNLLSKDLDEGLKILREVLAEPRFQEDKLKLRKEQLLSDMKQRNDDSADIEARERERLSYGDAYYLSKYATKDSLDAITRDDLAAFHKRWFAPQNVLVSAAGDFKRADLQKKLEALFAAWPYKGESAPPVPKPDHKLKPGLYVVDKDVNQGRVSILLPGLSRTDPDFFAAQIMNAVLGGGGFSSRIVNRVRSDEGLAYSAGSGLTGGVWYPGLLRAGFQSKVRTCAYATQIVLEEMKKMRAFGTASGDAAKKEADELATAKSSAIETLPRRFSTKAQTMGVLADEEFTGRFKTDPGYYASYRASVEKVTAADVRRLAERLLSPDTTTILAVGKKSDMLDPDPKHPVKFPDLAGGSLTDVPLRDPLTMKPIGK